MDWPSTNKGKGEDVPQGGEPRRVRRYSEVRRHATVSCAPRFPHTLFLTIPLYVLFLSLSLSRTLFVFIAFVGTFQRCERTPFGVSAPRFSPGRRLKNRTVIYGTALDGGIPLMGCLNVSILSLILLSTPVPDPASCIQDAEPRVTTVVNRDYFHASD